MSTLAQQAFGSLRQLMNLRLWSNADCNALRQLAQRIHREDPDGYQQMWLPYINDFPDHFEQQVFEARNVATIQTTLALLPLAKFRFVLVGQLLPEELQALMSCPHLDRVLDVYFIGGELDGGHFLLLCGLFSRSPLRSLRVQGCDDLGDMSILSLLQNDAFASIETLQFNYCGLTNRALDAIVSCPHLPKLSSLTLVGNSFDAAGLESLARHARDKPWEHLCLAANGIGEEGARALGQADFEDLWSLDISSNDIGSEGTQALSQAQWMQRLGVFDCEANQVDRAALMALCESLGDDLEYLSLKYNFFDAADLIATIEQFPQWLGSLNLGGNDLSDEGVIALAQSTQPAYLAYLSLEECDVGDEGVIAMSKTPKYFELHALDLSYNRITDIGAKALAQSPHLSNLEHLSLVGNDAITREGWQALAQSECLSPSAREVFAEKL